MKLFLRIMIIAAVILPPLPAAAREDGSYDEAFEEEEILIEAERPETPGLGEPGQTTTVTRAELEASGARTLAEFLQRIPGVKVNRQGGVLEAATLSIRGSSANQVLVLVDGVPQNDLWGGAVNLNALPLERIESVEIVRGGGSALHGEGALGGVVRLTTRKGEAWSPEFSITGGGGSFETFTGGFSLSGGLDERGDLSGRLFGEGVKTGGAYSYESSQGGTTRLNNEGFSGSLTGGLSWIPGGGEVVLLDLSGEAQATERGIPGLMEFLTPRAESREQLWGAGLALVLQDCIPGRGEIALRGSRRISEYINPDDNLDESHDNLGGILRAEWESPEAGEAVTFSGSLGIEGGADRLDSTGLTDSTGTALNGEARQLSGAAWGSLRIAGDRTALTPALRFDYFFQDYIGREEIQRNALSWSLTAEAVWPNLTVELSGQSSYRNPSFRDLFWPSGAFASGNPDLLPERGLGADLGITWDLKAGITATAAGFVQQVSDLIQWLPAAGGIWRPRNIGEVEIYGGEVSLKGILPLGEAEGSGIPWFIEYQGGYDWLRCRETTPGAVNSGNQLAYRPEHSGSLSLLLSAPGGSSLEVSGTLQGVRFTNNANTKFFDPLFLLDASWRFFLTRSWEIGLSGRNLTNRSYIDRLGYPVPGIEWILKGGFHY